MLQGCVLFSKIPRLYSVKRHSNGVQLSCVSPTWAGTDSITYSFVMLACLRRWSAQFNSSFNFKAHILTGNFEAALAHCTKCSEVASALGNPALMGAAERCIRDVAEVKAEKEKAANTT